MEPAPVPTPLIGFPTLSEACPAFTNTPVYIGEHITRSPNAWIIYLSWRTPLLLPVPKGEPKRDARLASKMCSVEWKAIPKVMRKHFSGLAQEAKEIHRVRYPDYKYRPDRRCKEEKAKEKRQTRNGEGKRSSKSRSKRGVERQMSTPWNPQQVAWQLQVPGIHPSAGPSMSTESSSSSSSYPSLSPYNDEPSTPALTTSVPPSYPHVTPEYEAWNDAHFLNWLMSMLPADQVFEGEA